MEAVRRMVEAVRRKVALARQIEEAVMRIVAAKVYGVIKDEDF